MPRVTPALEFILGVLAEEEYVLIGNLALAEEYRRYATRFASPTALELLQRLLLRTHLTVPTPESLRVALQHGLVGADALHAASCLDADAILISNDKDFDVVARRGLIEVWPISKAIRVSGP